MPAKIQVSEAKLTEALALYGMAAYDHLVLEGECRHTWKLTTMSGHNMMGELGYAYAYEHCEDCGGIRNHLNLLD
jgi:hypothetical protein